MALSPRLPYISSSPHLRTRGALWKARPRPKLDLTRWCFFLVTQFSRPRTVSHSEEQQLQFGQGSELTTCYHHRLLRTTTGPANGQEAVLAITPRAPDCSLRVPGQYWRLCLPSRPHPSYCISRSLFITCLAYSEQRHDQNGPACVFIKSMKS